MTDLQNISLTIAQHMARLRFEDLGEQTVRVARRSFLDAMGVMLAASGLAEDASPYLVSVRHEAGPCRLIGSFRRVSASGAALANGALAHALDFGDTFDAGPAHPNAALIPALLALADADPAIGAERFLTAMVAGADLACRLSLAPNRPYEEGGWYPPPLINAIASAAASAKLLGLSAEGICDAMGLALMQASFPAAIKHDGGSPMRGVREAHAARAAVQAALLARAGARAFSDPLGGRGGFFEVYGGGPPNLAFIDGLGRRFLSDEVSFKPWPACRGTHAYIEAALALREGFEEDLVARVEAEIGSVQEMLMEPRALKIAPPSAIDARFSIPYTIAVALIDGAVSLDSFGPDKLSDPRILSMAARVFPRVNPAWGRPEATSGSVRIHFDGGKSVDWVVQQAAGGADKPLTDAVLAEKFVHCAAKAANPSAKHWAEPFARNWLAGVDIGPAQWLPVWPPE